MCYYRWYCSDILFCDSPVHGFCSTQKRRNFVNAWHAFGWLFLSGWISLAILRNSCTRTPSVYDCTYIDRASSGSSSTLYSMVSPANGDIKLLFPFFPSPSSASSISPLPPTHIGSTSIVDSSGYVTGLVVTLVGRVSITFYQYYLAWFDADFSTSYSISLNARMIFSFWSFG